MYVKYLGKTVAQTIRGEPISGRTWHIYEFNTEKEAAFCEASYLMSVNEANGANQLFCRGKRLILDVPNWWIDAEKFKDLLLESIKNK